jgi:integrase
MGSPKRAGQPAELVWRDGERRAVAEYYDQADIRRRITLGWDLSEQDATDKLNQFNEAQRAVRAQQASHDVASLWKLWLVEREDDGFSNEIYNHNWTALKPFFGHRHPDTLTAADFRQYARARFALGRAPSTVHTELVRLRSCLKWAFDARLTPILVRVWVPSPGKGRKRVLTIEEARHLIEGASKGDPHVYVFVVLLFCTGARHTAILDLTWDRVDFDAGTIQYDEDLPRDPMSRAYRKGRATVPMNAAAREALKRAEAGRQTDFVVEHGGERLKECREGFASAVRRAGLGRLIPHPTKPDAVKFVTDITPHVIRHTVATWLDAQSIETKRAAQLLGHSDEETTRKIYTHASHEMLSEAVEALDAAFAPLPKIDASGADVAEETGDGSEDFGTSCQSRRAG